MILALSRQALVYFSSATQFSRTGLTPAGVVSGPLSSGPVCMFWGSRLDSGLSLQCLGSCLECAEENSLLKAVSYNLDLKKESYLMEGVWVCFHPLHWH